MAGAQFLSLCSGAGGLDIGLEMAGWQPVAQVEIDRDCCKTLEAYAASKQRGARVINSGIQDIDARELRLSLGLARGDLDLIAGGPPCQPFTTHGLRQTLQDSRAKDVFPSFLGYVQEFEPRAVVMENVDGLLSAALRHVPLAERGQRRLRREESKGSFLEWTVVQLDLLGYSVSWGIVEAADHGVAQYRQRAILVATRQPSPCYLPSATIDRPKTLREALSQVADPGPVQPLSERKRAIYAKIPAGGNWRNLPVEEQRASMGRAFEATGGKSGWWRRLAWDQPAPTILGMPDHSSTGLIHPDEVRCLGLRECAAVQSFPADMPFQGTARSQYQQVGNAVPPLLGKAIGNTLNAHLAGEAMQVPEPPMWRSESANRRIGTHGWMLNQGNQAVVTMNAKVRPDHVWAMESERFDVQSVAAGQGGHPRYSPALRDCA